MASSIPGRLEPKTKGMDMRSFQNPLLPDLPESLHSTKDVSGTMPSWKSSTSIEKQPLPFRVLGTRIGC